MHDLQQPEIGRVYTHIHRGGKYRFTQDCARLQAVSSYSNDYIFLQSEEDGHIQEFTKLFIQ